MFVRSIVSRLLLTVIVLSELCIADDFFKMRQYEGSASAWGTSPTWHANYLIADLKTVNDFKDLTVGNVNLGTVVDVAGRHYQWLKTQSRSRTPNGYRLVAVMFDAVDGSFWASTIPRGPREVQMIELASNTKPNIFGQPPAQAWWMQVRTLSTGTSAAFHAEDGCFFNWESVHRNRVRGGRYEGNLLIGVYGDWEGKDSKGKTSTDGPRPWNLCVGGNNPRTGGRGRVPSCQTVARNLNVRFAAGNVGRRAADDGGSMNANLTNAADYVGQPPSPADVAAAKAADAVCIEPNSAACKALIHQGIEPSGATSNPGRSSITANPPSKSSKPSCSLQNQDPDQGITQQFCICDGSKTLPLLSGTKTEIATAACDYTTLPDATTQVSTGFHSTTTNSALCEICSKVVDNENACTTIPHCTPTAAKASLTIATSPIHVGTLTGERLYTSVSHALEAVCPPVTQTTKATECTGTAVIKDIAFVEDGPLVKDGQLIVSAAFSSYNVTSLRDAMIQSLALSAERSASGKNCYNQSYTVVNAKRSPLLSRFNPGMWMSDTASITTRDRPEPEQANIVLCNMAQLALINYYSPFWRVAKEPGPTDFIEAQYKFREPNGDLLCEFIEDLELDLEAITPEFAAEETQLAESVDAVCQKLDDEDE